LSALDTTVPPVSREWKKSSSSTSSAAVWWRMKTTSIARSAVEEQVQQDEEALGHVLARLVHRADTSIRQNITAWVVGLGTLMRLL
jgi:hypothetical protein